MAYTFLKARARTIGDSLVEDDRVETARGRSWRKAGDKRRAPAAGRHRGGRRRRLRRRTAADAKIVGAEDRSPTGMGVDIGPATRAKFAEIVKGAKTVVWNGPMGVFEIAVAARARSRSRRRWPSHGARRDHHRRRRRLGRRGRADRPRRQDHPRLHRRRRLPRVPRGQGPARRRVPDDKSKRAVRQPRARQVSASAAPASSLRRLHRTRHARS